jgi:AcrR family transcriptional regulator
MTARKVQLLDAAIRFVAEHGIAGLSLRPLAAASGTSARLLIFHFGSKEKLLTELLGEIQRRFMAIANAPPKGHRASGRSPMRLFWDHLTRPENLVLIRILFEAQFIALQNPLEFGAYLNDTSRDWIRLIQSRLPPPLRHRRAATLCAAVFDGLLIELLGGGDLRNTTRALDFYIGLLVAEARR